MKQKIPTYEEVTAFIKAENFVMKRCFHCKSENVTKKSQMLTNDNKDIITFKCNSCNRDYSREFKIPYL